MFKTSDTPTKFMNQLTTNLVTHRLTVEMGGGEKKNFLLSKAEARQIQAGLNNKALQFLDIGDESFPKYGCRLAKLSELELKKMAETFVDYCHEHVHAAEVVEGKTRTIFIRKRMGQFSDSREEILDDERGYYLDGEFIKIN